MLRFSHRSCGGVVYPTVVGILGFEINRHDDNLESPTAKKLQDRVMLEYTPVTGWEGVKQMFSKQEPNGISVELLSCVQLGLCSAVTGFVLGGIESTKFTVSNFKEQNQATMYKNTFDAQRAVSDRVSRDFFKGGVKMAVKCGSFLFCFSVIASTLSTYRGKTNISDFATGGFLTGAIFTLDRGLLGAISGGIIGLVLGTVTGTAVVGLFWATGVNPEEVRRWQNLQYQKRVEAENKAYLKERERGDNPDEKLAFYLLTPEEKERGRILDKLDEVVKTKDVIIPEQAPMSMLRKEEKT